MTQWKSKKLIYVVIFAVVIFNFAGLTKASGNLIEGVLRPGMNGEQVAKLQTLLNRYGYPVGHVDGIYGDYTEQAVSSFQDENNLAVDGVAGPQTIRKINALNDEVISRKYVVKPGDTLWDLSRAYDVSMDILVQINNLSAPDRIRVGQQIEIPVHGIKQVKVEALHWDTAKHLFPITYIARVIDVKTGLSFYVRRCGGYLHADSEPLARKDVEIMKRVYGGTWSWERRAVIVEVAGKRIAASINGMPHGGQTIYNNGFNGHFCIHFLGSRVHASGQIDSTHQMMVRLASNY